MTPTLLALGSAALLLGAGHPAAAQGPGMPVAGAEEESELPHPFFTHMGIPEGRGVWNLRTAGLATREEGRTNGDFAFHLETGLSERIGLHVRNDRYLDVPQTEMMFQFAAIMSENGMSGFAPIIEFEIPTRAEGGDRVGTLVGFTTALANERAAFNQVVHYDPREDMVDASVAFVVGLRERVFPVVEVLGEGGTGVRPVVNVLAGLKVRVREGIVFGLAYQLPVTSNKEFSSQLVGMPELEWRVRR
ncbi:MAG: hypothetical protein ABS52_04510 [Gemmatimonadetes bacterium SCN 70-22]|nr:MAG: hypothetical protein ABS52_04510 [Gemmatimonadetes bacterium SCN 70-22]